jgi:hypothetical protein
MSTEIKQISTPKATQRKHCNLFSLVTVLITGLAYPTSVLTDVLHHLVNDTLRSRRLTTSFENSQPWLPT